MERKIGGFGFADLYAGTRRRNPHFLDAVEELIDWSRIEQKLRKKLRRSAEKSAGVKYYPALTMFKILLLQTWYDLSDQSTEEALCDRYSFSRFAGISLEADVPDHTTICRFRNLLAEKKILQKLLDEVNGQLASHGKLVKSGCAVDATIITSASRPRKHIEVEMVSADDEESEDIEGNDYRVTVNYSKDTEARWTCKGSRYYYGYKGHMSVDTDKGFVLAGHVTPANSSDTGEMTRLVRASRLPEKTRVYGDKGYCSQANRDNLRNGKVKLKDGIMNKATRGHALSHRQRQRNRLISSIRGIVERGFGTLKGVYGLCHASYLGVGKVENEFLLAAVAFNLKKAVFLPSP